MKKILFVFFAAVFSCVLAGSVDTRPFKYYYTLQVMTVVKKECAKGHKLYMDLKKANYMVYYIKDMERHYECVRVRVGVYETQQEAREAGEKFKKEQGLPYTVVRTLGITVTGFKDRFRIVNTPGGIWKMQDGNYIMVYSYGDQFRHEKLSGENPVSISPSGDDIVFAFDGKVIRYGFKTGKETVLVEKVKSEAELAKASPKWSPDGGYIAYLDKFAPKFGNCLRLIKADGTGGSCIVDNSGKKRTVMSFAWHPAKNKIYYVEGGIERRVPIGGELYVTGLDGKSEVVVKPEKGTEVYHDFDVHGNKLFYETARLKGKSGEKYDLTEYSMDIK